METRKAESMNHHVNQCGAPVDYLVRHPHWAGDFFCVCAKHLEWAKRCVGKGEVVITETTTENGYRTVISGCVWWDHTKHPTPKNRLPLRS